MTSAQCFSGVGFAFLLLSAVLSVIGLVGTWGQATFNIMGYRFRGDVTLWEVTVKPGAGWYLPDAKKYSIDDWACHGDLESSALEGPEKACNKLHRIRVAVIIGMLCALLAAVFASIAFASSLANSVRDRIVCAISVWLLLAGVCAALTILCAVAAVSVTYFPDNTRFGDFAGQGAGRVCTFWLFPCSLFGMVCEFLGRCSAQAEAAHELHAGERAKISKAPQPADDAC